MTWNSANLLSKVRNICKIFSLVPSKNRENWEKPGVYFWMIKFTRTQILPNCRVPNDFFCITVNFIIQKLKSKHLVCLSFLMWQIILMEREKIFYIYSGPKQHKNEVNSCGPGYRLFFLRSIAQFFYSNFHELFCQFISWTNWVNFGNSAEYHVKLWLIWKKVYDDIIIINLYAFDKWKGRGILWHFLSIQKMLKCSILKSNIVKTLSCINYPSDKFYDMFCKQSLF